MRNIFDPPHILKARANRHKPIMERIEYSCSRAQRLFWFLEQLHPKHPGLNISRSWQIGGRLPDETIEQAWQHLIQRHAALRTHFDRRDGEPIQVVESHRAFSVSFLDLRALPQSQAQLEAERLAFTESRTAIDLSVAPLFRVSRITLSDARSTLTITAHRAICDGKSLEILVQEMGEICSSIQRRAVVSLVELPITYGEFADAERTMLQDGSFEQRLASSRESLREYSPLELLSDRPRSSVPTSNVAIATRHAQHATISALAELAVRSNSTTFVIWLAAMVVLLHRYSGETNIVIGNQMSGRDSAEIVGVVGCFVKTRLIRADVSGDPTFTELLERMRGSVTNALEVEHFLVEGLSEVFNRERELSRGNLFSVNFSLDEFAVKAVPFEHFTVSPIPARATGAFFDLDFVVSKLGEGCSLSCEYMTDLYDGDTVSALLERLELLIRSVVTDPDQHVSRVPLLSAREREWLVVGANQTQSRYPADRTVVDLFTDQAAKTPSATAVVCGAVTLTYAQLDAASNRLARKLILRNFGPGKRIGVLLERSTDLVVALLAVLKAGSAYIPLDPAYPQERLAFIVEQSRLSTVISRSTLNDRITVAGAPFLNIDIDASVIECSSVGAIEYQPVPNDLAYVIYTSGSTGKPKGVAIEHRSLLNLLIAMIASPGITAKDVLLAVTTVSFDIAALEIFLPLIVGARLLVATELEAADGSPLLELMRRNHVTIVQATPITWQMLIDAGLDGDHCVTMLCGGEALSRKLADQLLDRCESLWNMYGPTETTIWSSASKVARGTGPVLIGAPIANTQFYVLDRNGEIAPPGVSGELFIGGDGVARGYFERPDLTQERFLVDTFRNVPGAKLYRTGDVVRRRGHDSFEFLGRNDQQIKIRGFRIELAEIEDVLLRQPDVKEAVVLIRGVDAADKAIWAFVVPRSKVANSGEDWIVGLRSRMSKSLPHYMVPSPMILLGALPRTPNGKVDRHALPQTVSVNAATQFEAPSYPIEEALATFISELLGLKVIGRNDDIFALGFNSLLAVRLISRIEEFVGVRISLRDLYDAETVAHLAICVTGLRQSALPRDGPTPIVTCNPHGSRTPFFYFHGDMHADGIYCRKLSAAIGSDQPVHAIAPHGTMGLAMQPTVESMGREHLSRVRQIQARGPYRLGGFCAGGFVAYEVARLLRAEGETVERLVLINAAPVRSNLHLRADPLIRRLALDARLDPGFRESLCWNLARLVEAVGLGPAELVSFFYYRTTALFAALSKRATKETRDDVELRVMRRGSPETEVYLAHHVAALTYHPQAYDSEISLVWSEKQPAGESAIEWIAYANRLRIASMEGGHISPLFDRVEELGRLLSDLLH